MRTRTQAKGLDTVTCRHTRKKYPPGAWERGENETPGLVFAGNGTIQVKMRCNRCGHRTGPLPFHVVRAWGLTESDYGWVKRNETVTYPPCVVVGCGVTPTEWHHFAPYNTFGAEADLWPVLPLCRPHHQDWHRRMNGYLWHRKAVA